MKNFISLLLSIIGLIIIIKSLIKRVQYHFKSTRCSLASPGKIVSIQQDTLFLYHIAIQYYAQGQFIERVIPVMLWQFNHYHVDDPITVDYDPAMIDSFIIEEDQSVVKYTNLVIGIGFFLIVLSVIMI